MAATGKPSREAGEPDPCLDAKYACEHYGDCCGNNNYMKDGHRPVCKKAKQFTVGNNCAAIGTHEGEM